MHAAARLAVGMARFAVLRSLLLLLSAVAFQAKADSLTKDYASNLDYVSGSGSGDGDSTNDNEDGDVRGDLQWGYDESFYNRTVDGSRIMCVENRYPTGE